MPTFKSKPKLVEAEQFFHDKPLPFRNRGPYVAMNPKGDFYVTTAHGQHAYLRDSDWIVLEPTGPHTIAFSAYPVRADIFENSYELADAVDAVDPVAGIIREEHARVQQVLEDLPTYDLLAPDDAYFVADVAALVGTLLDQLAQAQLLSAPNAAAICAALKAECETQHARAEAAEATLATLREERDEWKAKFNHIAHCHDRDEWEDTLEAAENLAAALQQNIVTLQQECDKQHSLRAIAERELATLRDTQMRALPPQDQDLTRWNIWGDNDNCRAPDAFGDWVKFSDVEGRLALPAWQPIELEIVKLRAALRMILVTDCGVECAQIAREALAPPPAADESLRAALSAKDQQLAEWVEHNRGMHAANEALHVQLAEARQQLAVLRQELGQ